MKRSALAGLLLALAIALAFAPCLWRGEGLMAAMAAPGVTDRGPASVPAGAPAPTLPVADGVAAFIDEPLAVYTARCLDDGDDLRWNPHNGLGVPLLGNWQSAIPSPLRLLVQSRPEPWAFEVTYLLRLLVAGLGALLLGRQLGLGARAALAAGVAFGLTGYFVRYLQMHHLNGEVWLPWLWLAADRLARRPRLPELAGFTAVAFCVVVGGNPQPALVAAVATAGFALSRSRQWRGRGVAWVAVATLPPVLLASVYWLAGLEYVRASVHHHSATFGGDAYTAAGALGFVLPAPYSRHGMAVYSELAPYFGLLPFVLALLGAGVGLGRSVFLWALLVLAGGKIAGLWGTGWIGAVPGFSMMKLFKYLYPAAALALALLAGAGVQALAERRVGRRRLAWVAALMGVVLAGGVALGVRTAARAEVLSFVGAPQAWWAAALLAALVAMAWWGRRPARVASAAVALLAIELVAATPPAWPPRRAPFEPPGFLAAWRSERPGTFRTFGAYGMWMPNQNAVFGVDDLRLHDGVFPARFGPFVQRFVDPNVRHWPVFTAEDLGLRSPELFEQGLAAANLLLPQQVAQDLAPPVLVNPFARDPGRYLDLVNVRYLVLPARYAEIARQLMPPDQRLVYEDHDAIVVERASALPRAFFPGRIVSVGDLDAALDAMAAPDFDGRDVAYLELASPAVDVGPASGSARVDGRPHPDELELSVQATDPAYLVVSVYPYPGFRAEIAPLGNRHGREPRPAAIVPVDGSLSAVLVPRGRSRVRIFYEPTYGSAAWWLSALGAVILLLLALRLRRNPAAAD